MILNTKYHDVRELINKKLEEFFNSLDHLEPVIDQTKSNENNKDNTEDVQMLDESKINENGDATSKHINTNNAFNNANKEDKNDSNSKIYLSTSQIMTKILLGKFN